MDFNGFTFDYDDMEDVPDLDDISGKPRPHYNCTMCKYYSDKEQYDEYSHPCAGWCERWDNARYGNNLHKGCKAFAVNPKCLQVKGPTRMRLEHEKEARRIKRLKREGKIPLSYYEWARENGIGFMTGLGDEDGYDEYLSSFHPGFGPD